jgi:hypothetical protein
LVTLCLGSLWEGWEWCDGGLEGDDASSDSSKLTVGLVLVMVVVVLDD